MEPPSGNITSSFASIASPSIPCHRFHEVRHAPHMAFIIRRARSSRTIALKGTIAT
ncbi:hypothetical protein HMPREF3196_00954 [Bifidobacterium bifidum]|uniref:Uncharacterized protein n=1 Tax=Bifidobacterium bifidum TaxID=1681 RepID=A0A133KQ15_BIFBI|nr:hypothetical protein HMPREF3196_00954 [Bifidobacterium bifidum]